MCDSPNAQPRRALLATSVLPWPLHRNGGAQRTDLLRQALRAAGCAVDIVAAIPQPGSELPAAEELLDHGVRAAFGVDVTLEARPQPSMPRGLKSLVSLAHVRRLMQHRYAPAPVVARWVADHLAEYDVVVVRYLQTALLCGLDRRNPTEPPPVLVDLDDLDWLALASRFGAQPWPGLSGRMGMASALGIVKKRSRRALPAFNRLFVTNETDREALRELGLDSMLLPNIPYTDPSDPDRLAPLPPTPDDAREVLFIGDLQFGPNATGLDWFLAECWPKVRAGVPDAILRIVGRGASDEQRAAWSKPPGVEVVGFTLDIRSEYARCACTIAPTHWGGGTKIKVVESAALGRACVATPHAARGYEPLTQGPAAPVIVAADPAAFAAAVIDLLRSPASRAERGFSGPVLAGRGFSFDVLCRTIAAALPWGSPSIPPPETPADRPARPTNGVTAAC